MRLGEIDSEPKTQGNTLVLARRPPSANFPRWYNRIFLMKCLLHLFDFSKAALGRFENGLIAYSCGGNIITEHYILTAAHCYKYHFWIFCNSNSLQFLKINFRRFPTLARVGTIDLASTSEDDGSQIYNITRFIIHPKDLKLPPQSIYHDIALIYIEEEIQ